MAMIRLATAADAKAFSEIYGRSVATGVASFEYKSPTEDEFKKRIATVMALAPWLVCEKDGQVLGYAYASEHRVRAAYQWCVDVGVYIREDSHRLGIGRALYTSLLACLKLQGFYAVHAGVTLPNPGSVALHESFGFQKVGVYRAVGFKFGAWHDVGWWQLELRERTGTPEKTRTVAEIQSSAPWESAIGAGISLLKL